MSKAHRGTGIRNEANHGRGKCPRCGNPNVKVLYEKEIDGKTVKICKVCNATLKNIARKEARAGKAAAAVAAKAEASADASAQA